MKTSPLESIITLQGLLDRLSEADRLLAGVPDWMRELHEEHSARHAEIAALEAAAQESAQSRRAAEAAVQDSQERLRRFQEQIGLVRTQREYAALLQEIDLAKQAIKTHEEQAFAAMEHQDELQRRLAGERSEFRDLDERYGVELAKWEAEKPQVAAEADGLRRGIAELRSGLPRPVLADFDRIRERHHGQALAPVHRIDRGSRGPQMWHCGACNYRVRPQSVVEIRNQGGIMHCDSCKRILFIETESS